MNDELKRDAPFAAVSTPFRRPFRHRKSLYRSFVWVQLRRGGGGTQKPNLSLNGGIMSDTGEAPASNAGRPTVNVETDDTSNEEGLAAILLRVLGVYFLGWAIITGVEEAVRLLIAISTYSADKILPGHWTSIAYTATVSAVGAYLLFGGQWVLEKVLLPVAPNPQNGEHINDEHVASGDRTATEGSPGTTVQ
jgi:hypothetical protein